MMQSLRVLLPRWPRAKKLSRTTRLSRRRQYMINRIHNKRSNLAKPPSPSQTNRLMPRSKINSKHRRSNSHSHKHRIRLWFSNRSQLKCNHRHSHNLRLLQLLQLLQPLLNNNRPHNSHNRNNHNNSSSLWRSRRLMQHNKLLQRPRHL